MKIGIYSGSFNPIHNGHIALANYILNHTDLDEIWLVVTPHNPLKEKDILIDDALRLQMVKLATESQPHIKASDIEFSLPKPSYTIQTLQYLTAEYPHDDFTLIIGADNLAVFHLWKDYQTILSDYNIMVYPRKGYDNCDQLSEMPSVTYLQDAPLFDVSSTEIRDKIKAGEDVGNLLPDNVWKFIQDKKLYK